MIKSLMVFTDGSPGGNVATEYGVFLAARLKAHLSGCHVLDSRMLDGPLMADISGWIGAQPYSGQLQQFRELMQQKAEAIMAAFEQKAAEAGLDADTSIKMGHPASVLLAEEAHAELVILGQNGEHAELTGDMIGSIVERVVRHSIKPCLVTPGQFQPITRILVAYDGSGFSSKALHEAIELALALAVPLVILTVAEDHDLERARAIAEDGIRLARAHECAAGNLVVEGRADQLVLSKAEELSCDLIVVGAYGHSRIREMILGSTTQNLVTRSHLPILLVR
jgi:nucleotide-binding universal stress UspA family protein